jgi:hypothetical protein
VAGDWRRLHNEELRLAQDRDQLWAVVNKVMNLRILLKVQWTLNLSEGRTEFSFRSYWHWEAAMLNSEWSDAMFTQLANKLHAFYGTPSFITVFTMTRKWSLYWARCIQSTPSHPNSPRYTVTLYFHLRLGLLSSLFSCSNQYIVCICHFFHACYMSYPSNPAWFDHPNNIWWGVQVVKLLIMHSSPSCHFLPLGCRYSPQHHFLKHP